MNIDVLNYCNFLVVRMVYNNDLFLKDTLLNDDDDIYVDNCSMEVQVTIIEVYWDYLCEVGVINFDHLVGINKHNYNKNHEGR